MKLPSDKDSVILRCNIIVQHCEAASHIYCRLVITLPKIVRCTTSVNWLDNVMINHDVSLKVTMFSFNFGDLTSWHLVTSGWQYPNVIKNIAKNIVTFHDTGRSLVTFDDILGIFHDKTTCVIVTCRDISWILMACHHIFQRGTSSISSQGNRTGPLCVCTE